MSRPNHIFVFCYDVEKDSARARISDLLSENLVRVQQSVFEGRMTTKEAHQLAKKASALISPEDNLRVYCIGSRALELSLAFGPTPLPEPGDFWLL